jgi:hypothetical protein
VHKPVDRLANDFRASISVYTLTVLWIGGFSFFQAKSRLANGASSPQNGGLHKIIDLF